MPQPIAVVADLAMLARLGVEIVPESADVSDMPKVTDPLAELGSRYLIKYIRAEQQTYYSALSGVASFAGPHYLTPTPLHQEDLAWCLNLPPLTEPVRALFLLPELLNGLKGPRRIFGGNTVEYVCDSFDVDAIANPKWGVLL